MSEKTGSYPSISGSSPATQLAHRGRSRSRRQTTWLAVLLLGLTLIALLLRTWQLNTIPPGLFGDEAQSGIDVQAWLQGQSTQLFPHHLGGETLLGYLSVPFIALPPAGSPWAIRIVAALMGVAMVPALFLAGVALWRERPELGRAAGLIAASLWVVNYWPQSVNRIGFQVNTQPFILTLAVIAWLNWSYCPIRSRAVLFGLLAGLTLITYPAARITPVLWPVAYLVLPSAKRKALRPTLLWAIAAFLISIAPVTRHFILHPYYLTNRASTFAALGSTVTLGERLHVWLNNALQVAGVFLGGAGDPDARHNLPGRPAFAFWLVAPLIVGVGLALFRLRRREQAAWTLLLWLGILSVPAIAAGDANPHYLRLLGALPAALLLLAWPLAHLLVAARQRSPRLAWVLVGLFVLLVVVEGYRTTHAYFVSWAKETDLYYTYQEDVWLLGNRIADTPDGVGIVPVDPTMLPDFIEHSLAYGFPNTPLWQIQVRENEIAGWLQQQLAKRAPTKVLVPIWHEGPEAGADAKGLVDFYLAREGRLLTEDAYRGFDLLTFALETPPQFQAAGQSVVMSESFADTLRLTGIQWGAAYPNADRSSDRVAAGTAVWAILAWQLDRAAPDLTVALDAVDPAGHRIASQEDLLLNAARQPVSQWQVGETAYSYHLVTIPSTQLPGEIALEVRVYDTDALTPLLPSVSNSRGSVQRGRIEIIPAIAPLAADQQTIGQPLTAQLPNGVQLIGEDVWPTATAPGQTLSNRLFFETSLPLAVTQTYTISLATSNVSIPVRLPAHTPVQQPVHLYVDLTLPPDLPSGQYPLQLTTDNAATTIQLGELNVQGRPHSFAQPALSTQAVASFGDAVRLLGSTDLSPIAATAGQTLHFSLVWQALGTQQQSLVRFVHLLGADGHPLAQQDTVLCAGACPASSWLAGEILLDEVALALPADLPPGRYTLAVGWYDATAPAQRLRVAGEVITPPPTDGLFVLPLTAETSGN